MSSFLINLLGFINLVLHLYMWVVIGSAVISWVNPDPGNPIVRFLRGVTEPVYYRIRRLIPTNFGGIDIAPIILILVIVLLQQVVIGTIVENLRIMP